MDFDTIENFTKREQDIAQLLVLGFDNNEISRKLNVSKSTVKNEVSVIINKLQATNRTHAAFILGVCLVS